MCFFGSLQEPAKKSINGINKTYSSPPVVEIKNKQFSVGFSVGFFFFYMIHPQIYQGLGLRKEEKRGFKSKEFQEMH